MKRPLFFLTLCVLLALCCAASAWTCTFCWNDASLNFCNVCGASRPTNNCANCGYALAGDDYYCPSCGQFQGGYVSGNTGSSVFSGVSAPLLMRLATRSGPSTDYTEPGSFFQAGHMVSVHSISYDINGVPWVQVEFTYNGSLMRAYTGLKRVDVNSALLPEEAGALYTSKLNRTVQPRRGPGNHYALEPDVTLRANGTTLTITGHENDWAQVEYYSPDAQKLRRVWVPTDALNYHW